MYSVLIKPSIAFFFLLIVAVTTCLQDVNGQVLPLDQKNSINQNWLVQDNKTAQLVPLVGDDDVNSVHQWVYIEPEKPFLISFAAPKELSLFLNNNLVFTADSAGTYVVDLAGYSKIMQPVKGKYLMTVWHPSLQPNVKSFKNVREQVYSGEIDRQGYTAIKVREYISQNIFIILLLVVGLIYGYLRTSFPADFYSVFSPGSFLRTSSLQEGLLAKPIGSWASILFVLAFSLSLALLIVAVHTNVLQIKFFNQILPVSSADITTKVVFYTVLIFIVILLKYLFIKLMSFIFGLEEVVELQYREFIRTLLFLGLFIPILMLFYLVLYVSAPDVILRISNIGISLLLIITTVRVSASVNTKAPVLNLHLFSYLCATEVIPLAIMLKIAVLNF